MADGQVVPGGCGQDLLSPASESQCQIFLLGQERAPGQQSGSKTLERVWSTEPHGILQGRAILVTVKLARGYLLVSVTPTKGENSNLPYLRLLKAEALARDYCHPTGTGSHTRDLEAAVPSPA